MNFGLCTLSNTDASVQTVVETAGRVGYDGVEIWGRDHVGDGSTATCRDIVDCAEEAGVEIPVYGSYLRLGTPSFADEVGHEVAVADRLGADRIRVWAGDREYEDCDEAYWADVVADLREIADRAADHGVDVTVEKHANTVTDDREGARRLVEEAERERVGLNWQPGFWLSPEELVAEARVLAPLSNNVHVQAVREPGSRDRCPLSAAYFDVAAILEPFGDGSFDGSVNVEFVDEDEPYETAVADDLAYLRSVTG